MKRFDTDELIYSWAGGVLRQDGKLADLYLENKDNEICLKPYGFTVYKYEDGKFTKIFWNSCGLRIENFLEYRKDKEQILVVKK